MADRIWNSRFFNNDRVPAWHKKGHTKLVNLTAQDAYNLTGTYDVNLVRLMAGDMETDYSIIIREATSDDPKSRIFGSPVHKSYELIDAAASARIWDMAMGNVGGAVAAPTETFGVLGKGEEVFITTKTKTLSIKGDEVDVFEFMYSPMYSNHAAVIGITPVRIVCANTLTLGLKNATQRYNVVHTPGARAILLDKLTNQHASNLALMTQVQEAFTALADKPVKSEKEAEMFIRWIYPDAPMPEEKWSEYTGLTFEEHEAKYELKMAGITRDREVVLSLFAGEGRGMKAAATNGTRFGLYNAVAEHQTFRLGAFERTAVSLVAGDRGQIIQHAFNVLTDYKSN